MAISDNGFLFDPGTGNTYTLNETAVIIFNCLKGGVARKDIVARLAQLYEVTAEQAEADTGDILVQLKEFGLLHE
jgi:PqqD family protein of HPr-rel-A system